MLLCDARGDAIREQHHLRALLSRRVDGLIVVGESTNPRPSVSKDLPVPVVYAYGPSEDPSDVSFVPDDVGAAAMAVNHLLALGRRRIAHVTGPAHYKAARDREEGAAPGAGRGRGSSRRGRRCQGCGRSGGGGTRPRCC
ncbi:hypothetical protein [Nonomuraea rubra]|uniref:hypothetical protein n=1 Tax=Nonomuraea rubra TaxID=46180 RepID=UPI0031EB3FAB